MLDEGRRLRPSRYASGKPCHFRKMWSKGNLCHRPVAADVQRRGGILKIIERYSRLRIPEGSGDFLFGQPGRIFWLKATVTIAFCIGLLMSSRLWIGPRSYPLAPVSSILPPLPYPLDCFLFAALFALAALIVILPKPQGFIGAFLVIVLVSCLLDQTRWQPWVYLYSFLLATLALFSWDDADAAGQKRALNIARLIVASTYVFSGLQKINSNFIESDFRLGSFSQSRTCCPGWRPRFICLGCRLRSFRSDSASGCS